MRCQLYTDTDWRCTPCNQAKNGVNSWLSLRWSIAKAAIFSNAGLTLPFNYRLGHEIVLYIQNSLSSCGGDGNAIFSADVWTEWDLKIFLDPWPTLSAYHSSKNFSPNLPFPFQYWVIRDISGPEYERAKKVGQWPISHSFACKTQNFDGPFGKKNHGPKKP